MRRGWKYKEFAMWYWYIFILKDKKNMNDIRAQCASARTRLQICWWRSVVYLTIDLIHKRLWSGSQSFLHSRLSTHHFYRIRQDARVWGKMKPSEVQILQHHSLQCEAEEVDQNHLRKRWPPTSFCLKLFHYNI